jgi:hypothetical protein
MKLNENEKKKIIVGFERSLLVNQSVSQSVSDYRVYIINDGMKMMHVR